MSGGNAICSSSEGKRAVTTGGGMVSLNDEAGGTEVSTGASGETSATEGNCGSGIEASVDKSGVVPCRDVVTGNSTADKSGTVPCRDVVTGDVGHSAETSGEASEAPLLLGS